MEAIVLKTLKRIRTQAPRKLKDLRSVCDDLINALSSNESIAATNNAAANASLSGGDADKYFDPLQAACESQDPKVIEIALDGICTLIGQSANHITLNNFKLLLNYF